MRRKPKQTHPYSHIHSNTHTLTKEAKKIIFNMKRTEFTENNKKRKNLQIQCVFRHRSIFLRLILTIERVPNRVSEEKDQMVEERKSEIRGKTRFVLMKEKNYYE